MILQRGGKIDDTRTMFSGAMSALRRAISKEVSFSLCVPIPLVRNILLGTYISVSPGAKDRAIIGTAARLSMFARRRRLGDPRAGPQPEHQPAQLLADPGGRLGAARGRAEGP